MAHVEWFGAPDHEPVVVVPWNPRWAADFETWRTRLQTVLDPDARIEHIGSTAIPHLIAKPIIDILVSVGDLGDEAGYRPALESLGLPLRAREPEHRFFRAPVGARRDVHVHVCQHGGRWERDHLLFRDYLRAHPEVADRYARHKERLAQTLAHDRARYTDAKAALIGQIVRQASAWADVSD